MPGKSCFRGKACISLHSDSHCNSVLLISPTNQILLLHRVQTSSSFPSAHVFPGGNLSAEQDGEIPGVDNPARHEDGNVYRLAAVRECFEESGILLAKRADNLERLLELSDEERYQGRHAIHENTIGFQDWVKEHKGVPDVGAQHYCAKPLRINC